MRVTIPRDTFNNPQPPSLFLCNVDKQIIGEVSGFDVSLDGKWNAYGEIHFTIHRIYTDVLTGETKVNTLFDKIMAPRLIFIPNVAYWTIQDDNTVYESKDTKEITCFSSEYSAFGNKYLNNFYINTGEDDSQEVMYWAAQYGENYAITKDDFYKLASGDFDSFESYYIRDYQDTNTYIYQQVEVLDASDYATYNGSTVENTLYVKKFPNVRFYDAHNQALSLVHLVLAYVPEWTVGHVDIELQRKERQFKVDREAIYNFLTGDFAETFQCIVEFNTLTNTVNFYAEADDGITDNNTVDQRYDTNIYLSRDNLAQSINIKCSADNIKTRLLVTGADNLDIREINLGKNYIMNLDYYHTTDWMGQDLYDAYTHYLEIVDLYQPQYLEAMQAWVAANNKRNDLMNAIPADGNVVLIGDLFKKLYCIYSKYNHVNEFNADITQYYVMNDDGSMSVANPQPIASNFSNSIYYAAGDATTIRDELIKRLTLYHINEDISANQSDNILLRLKNNSDDVATIRIYNASTAATEQAKKDNPDYKIQIVIVHAATGISEVPIIREITDWIDGDLRISNVGVDGMSFLDGFKVIYIGTMGAYFVLAKDEREVDNLRDYGIKLLQSKQNTYITIFQTQTEAMFSQDKYKCIVSDTQPVGVYDDKTRWLNTGSSPLQLYQYSTVHNTWSVISGTVSPGDAQNYQNYQRYIDNFDKLKAVQEVLMEKEAEAEYWLNGFVVNGRHLTGDNITEHNMYGAALQHFTGHTVTRRGWDANLFLYTFTTSKDANQNIYAVYLRNGIPYVSMANSQGVSQARMDKYASLTDPTTFFTEGQWSRLSAFIREDEFNDSNFALTGYESEEERLKICQELMQAANKELNTLCKPSLEFSMDMANILALPEFMPILDQFTLGNFVKIELRPGLVKRARLLEVHLNFSDLSDFSCTFGNLITTRSEIDLHADLLKQAVQAGQKVATTAGIWQKAVDKSNKLEEQIANGLSDATIEIGKANNQSITWDQYGIWGRKFQEGSQTDYEPEQFRISNNKILFSNDGFITSKAVFGKYVIDGEERWGPLAEYVDAGTITGSKIIGGSLSIGSGNTRFVVNEDGSVEISENGVSKYASASDLSAVQEARRFHTELVYSGSTIFTEPNSTLEIICKVYQWDTDITSQLPNGTTFTWIRSSSSDDNVWNANHIYTKTSANANTVNQITINNDDLHKNAQFTCEISFDETQLPTI